MDKTVYNEATAAGTCGETRDRVNSKFGMGFEAGKYDWGDIRDVTLKPDRDRGYACARVTHCEAYRLVWDIPQSNHQASKSGSIMRVGVVWECSEYWSGLKMEIVF